MNSHGVIQRLTDITMAMDCQKETGKEPFSLNNKQIFFMINIPYMNIGLVTLT